MKKMLFFSFIGLCLLTFSSSNSFPSWDAIKTAFHQKNRKSEYYLNDARPEYKEKIEDCLKQCNIDPASVIIKENKLTDRTVAYVCKEFDKKHYLVIDPTKNPLEGKETLHTFFHEIGHIYNDHCSLLKYSSAKLLAEITTHVITNILLSKALEKSLTIQDAETKKKIVVVTSNLMSIYFGFSAGAYFQKKLSKFQEMEADLFAIDQLMNPTTPGEYKWVAAMYVFDRDYDDIRDDGIHPTSKEKYEYGSQFYKEKLMENNPSIKKYCWKYMLLEHSPAPIRYLLKRFVKND